jgi:branched-chain amino acid transport system substrate-binding protein
MSTCFIVPAIWEQQADFSRTPEPAQKLGDKDALRAALRAADFRSVRGNFKFGANHYPVQDFWLCQVAKRADGKFQTETVRKVLENDTDPWAAECRMR